MTLIAGIILPNGILMVSDTRVKEGGVVVQDEDARKITFITPTTLIGTSGFEATYHTAQVLRETLYNNYRNMSITEKREKIFGLYKHVNKLHLTENTYRELGSILLGEYNQEDNTFNLVTNTGKGLTLFDNEIVYNKVKDTVIIGANEPLRDGIKYLIQEFLNKVPLDALNHPNFHSNISEYIRAMFIEAAHLSRYDGISDKLYCVYITTINGQPVKADYLIDSDGSFKKVHEKQNSKEILY
ncbi:Ntn hydrolase family protein [Bacillus thuringiensis]|uniref:hypothetical protein n=1 Tax=Bacillus thuringiensis TaxID=1428 RepID=UPI002225F711|nr:hypothetical protein [Bacillus thuringiensis]